MAPVLNDMALHTYIGGTPSSADELRDLYRLQVAGSSPMVRRSGSTGYFVIVTTVWQSARSRRPSARPVPAQPAEVAWVIGTSHQATAMPRRAALAMTEWLREHSVVTVVAYVHPEHQASIAVARALGLKATNAVVDGETRWQG